MNKIFKTVWNTVRKCLVVVKETTKSAAQSSSAGGSVVDQSVACSSNVTAKHSKHTLLILPLVIFCGFAQANSITKIQAGETRTLEGTLDTPAFTTYWRDLENYGTAIVKGVSNGFGIQDAKGGHWRNYAEMYVYDYGINNSRNNEHDNWGNIHLMTQNALFSSGFRNHGSAKVYSVTKALLNINERTKQVTDTTRFNALHNNAKINVGLGTGQVRNVKEITGVTSIKFGDMTFESSSNGLIFTDVVAGSASAQAILNTLKGHGQYAKPQVSFTGSGVDAYGANGLTFTELNLDAARDAKNKGYAGAIFYNDALKLGGATKYLSDIGSNMGFKSIDGTMNVNQGLVLTLSGASGAGYLMSGNTAVMENGVLTLGNSQLSSGGKLKVVNLNNGALAVDAGTFSVDGLKVANNAVVTVANGSTLNVAGLGGTFNTWLVDGNAHLKNGSLTIRGLSGNGLFSNDGAQLTLNADAIGMNIKNAGALALGYGLLSKAITNTGYVTTQNALHFGSDGRYSQSAGTLTTQQDSFFENVNFSEDNPLKTIGLSATIPEEIKTTLTEHFQKYVPGNVTQEIIDHAAFTGGKVVIIGVNLTTTMRDDLTQAFKETF